MDATSDQRPGPPLLTDSQKWLVLLGLAGLGWLVYQLSPILTPFVAGATLAYLGDPMADYLQRLGLSRTVSVLLVFLALFLALGAALFLLLPALESQIDWMIDNLPTLLRWVKSSLLPWLQRSFGVSLRVRSLDDIASLVTQHWDGAGGAARSVIMSISHSGAAVLAGLANFVLIPVVTFYLLSVPTASRLVAEADDVLSAFVRGQLTVMLALSAIYCAGLWIIGLDLAFLVGLLAGLVSFVPYAGSLVGIATASAAAIVQFGDAWSLIPVLVVFGVGQTIEGVLLTPWLVGDRIGLHPVAVIFSVLAGGQLFGFIGVLLALPVASVVMVLIRHVHDLYKDSPFYADTVSPDAGHRNSDASGIVGSAGPVNEPPT